MNEKLLSRQFSKKNVKAHLQDHIKASKAVEERRDEEVKVVLGPIPTFAECEASFQKTRTEREQERKK